MRARGAFSKHFRVWLIKIRCRRANAVLLPRDYGTSYENSLLFIHTFFDEIRFNERKSGSKQVEVRSRTFENAN